jgi:hypothetical protein
VRYRPRLSHRVNSRGERGFGLKMCDSYQHSGGLDRLYEEKEGVFLTKGGEGDRRKGTLKR